MAKTVFVHGTAITPEFLNAINSPRFVDVAENDGDIPLPRLPMLPDVQEAIEAETSRAELIEQTLSQQISNIDSSVVNFGSLSDLIPGSTATLPDAIRAQYRMAIHRRKVDGLPIYADLDFIWSASFADSSSCGWTIPAKVSVLGASVDAALRGMWGIDSAAEWTYPFLFGEFYFATTIAPVAIYHQPSGSKIVITAADSLLQNMWPHGRCHFRIPGR